MNLFSAPFTAYQQMIEGVETASKQMLEGVENATSRTSKAFKRRPRVLNRQTMQK
jgi:hypothetical protein